MKLFVVDAHRQGVDLYETIVDLSLIEPEIHVQNSLRRTDEVAHVVVRVEGDQICAQHSSQ